MSYDIIIHHLFKKLGYGHLCKFIMLPRYNKKVKRKIIENY